MSKAKSIITLDVDENGYVFDSTYEPPTKRRDVFDIFQKDFHTAGDVLSLTDEYTRARFVLENLYLEGLGNKDKTKEELEELWIDAQGQDLMGWFDNDFVEAWLRTLSENEWREVDKEFQTWLDEVPDFDEYEAESNYPADGYAFAYQLLESEDTSTMGIELIDGFAPGNDARAAKLLKPIEEVNALCEQTGSEFRFKRSD